MRNKIKRFEDNKKSENLIEPGKNIYDNIKGHWNENIFRNRNPITLEIGCGNGMYSIQLSEIYKNRNFIGIDIKGSRLWVGSQMAIISNISNVAFLRTRIEDLEKFFKKNEIQEIILTFPDPRSKDSDQKKRLTSPRFLKIYKNIIDTKGTACLKTDSLDLFNYTLGILKNEKMTIKNYTLDLYNSKTNTIHKNIQSKYEKKFLSLGKSIKFIQFCL